MLFLLCGCEHAARADDAGACHTRVGASGGISVRVGDNPQRLVLDPSA